MQRKLYLILARELNRVKIGISCDPNERLKQLQTCSPTKLELFAFKSTRKDIVSEKELHQKYCDKREVGEWFNLNPIDYVSILKKWKYDVGIHYTKRNHENLAIGDIAYISWDSMSLCRVIVKEVGTSECSVEIVENIGSRIGKIGWTHGLFLDEVRKHPLDALVNRVTF